MTTRQETCEGSHEEECRRNRYPNEQAIPSKAQTNYDTLQVRTVPLTHTVYLLQGGGGNILVSAGSDAVFAVDA